MLILYQSLMDDEGQRIRFEQIYNAYKLQMVHLAKSYLHSDTDAEDVVHDVFLRVAAKRMKFIQGLKDPEDVRNYLLKATKNTALNELKRKGRGHVSLEDAPEESPEDALSLTDDDFIEMICAKAEYDRVVKALLSMDEPYRDILYYHFVMELSVPEAAKLLGHNVTAAKKQLVRGKKMLLVKLGLGGDQEYVDD